MILQPNVSEEVFWEYVHEDANCELIEGDLIIHSPASKEHEDIFGHLYTLIRLYLEKRKEGRVFGSRFVMRLSKKWSPEPDLLVILSEHYSNIKDTFYDGSADLVIEILSPSTRELDLGKKLPKYLEAGVKEVWIVDPEKKDLTVHHENDAQNYRDPEADDIVASSILPGLPFRIKWLWEREKFPVIEIIKEMSD